VENTSLRQISCHGGHPDSVPSIESGPTESKEENDASKAVGLGTVAGCCEHGNEALGFIRGGEFLD